MKQIQKSIRGELKKRIYMDLPLLKEFLYQKIDLEIYLRLPERWDFFIYSAIKEREDKV